MDYIVQELKNLYGLDWQNLVSSGELGRLKAIFRQANEETEELIEQFRTQKRKAIKTEDESFLLNGKEYDLSEATERIFIRYHTKKGLKKRRALYAYRFAEQNSWVYKTLLEKKKTKQFRECKRLILVGSGIYPYSLFDIHKKYKHIKMIGIEIDKDRYIASKQLVENSPAKDRIIIVNQDGNDFDYSKLEETDLVFVSCDVDSNSIVNKVIQTSKAPIYICAPYNKEWMKETIQKSNIVYDKQGRIISL